ncbi:MAG TPA: D-erythronate dehydrogenase [Streptosporangiaceae bacterium]|nr:D-erythronate dehydrogenase [Streptosporangiaceae bacterium]
MSGSAATGSAGPDSAATGPAKIVITGGAGFLGSRLARQLLAAGTVSIGGGPAREISQLTLVDQAPVQADLAADERVSVVSGDLGTIVSANTGGDGTDGARSGVLDGAELIFHLAAAVSAECEADFDLGMRANVHATESLLESCRALGTNPVVAFASSIAVFGGSAEHRLPAVIEDSTLPNPQSSYGAQKVICEQLLADYTRKGFVRGRAMRLMTVSVRPGRPNGAATGFLSGIIREPLAGQRAICPVEPDVPVALASPAKAIAALMCAATSSQESWGGRSAVNMPALSVTVADLVTGLERAAGPATTALIDWVPDPLTSRLMASWPSRFDSERAAGLGLTQDPDIDSVIAMHIEETGWRP